MAKCAPVLLEYASTSFAHAGRARRVPNHVQATSRNDGNMSLGRDVSATRLEKQDHSRH